MPTLPSVLPGPTSPIDPAPSFLDRLLPLRLGWITVAAILCLQWLLFSHWALREVTWGYPGIFDQNLYLGHSYRAFEDMRTHGVVGGLWRGLNAGLPQGNLLHTEAAFYYLFAGPSRLSALTVVWFHWASLQLAMVATMRWLTRSWSASLVTLGLLLTTTSRFAEAGGQWDFRLDFSAACLYGVALCALVRSRCFQSRPWSVVVGLVTGLLILCRHLSALSVLPVIGIAMVYSAICAVRARPGGADRAAWRSRSANAVVAAALGLALSGPILWNARAQIVSYYGAHITTDEGPLRRAEQGVFTILEFGAYYPRSLLHDHLGATCALLLAGLAIGSGLGLLRQRARAAHPVSESWLPMVMLVAAGVVPLSVLTLVPTRSPVVAGFVLAPAIGVVLAAVASWVHRGIGRGADLALKIAASACIVAGLATDVRFGARRGPMAGKEQDIVQLATIVDAVGRSGLRHGPPPTLALDRIVEFMHVAIFQPWYYERQGVWVELQPILGGGILAVPDQDVLAAVNQADVLVLTDPSSPDVGFPYPYHAAMKRLYPQLAEVAAREFIPIAQATVFSQRLTAYGRVPLVVDGADGTWITSRGFTVHLNGNAVREKPIIELGGAHPLARYFTGPLQARVRAVADGRPIGLASSFSTTATEYTLIVRVSPGEVPAGAEVLLEVSFDNAVIPKAVGINDDQRELVVMIPNRLRLRASDAGR
jgi:hypothetical protein